MNFINRLPFTRVIDLGSCATFEVQNGLETQKLAVLCLGAYRYQPCPKLKLGSDEYAPEGPAIPAELLPYTRGGNYCRFTVKVDAEDANTIYPCISVRSEGREFYGYRYWLKNDNQIYHDIALIIPMTARSVRVSGWVDVYQAQEASWPQGISIDYVHDNTELPCANTLLKVRNLTEEVFTGVFDGSVVMYDNEGVVEADRAEGYMQNVLGYATLSMSRPHEDSSFLMPDPIRADDVATCLRDVGIIVPASDISIHTISGSGGGDAGITMKSQYGQDDPESVSFIDGRLMAASLAVLDYTPGDDVAEIRVTVGVADDLGEPSGDTRTFEKVWHVTSGESTVDVGRMPSAVYLMSSHKMGLFSSDDQGLVRVGSVIFDGHINFDVDSYDAKVYLAIDGSVYLWINFS